MIDANRDTSLIDNESKNADSKDDNGGGGDDDDDEGETPGGIDPNDHAAVRERLDELSAELSAFRKDFEAQRKDQKTLFYHQSVRLRQRVDQAMVASDNDESSAAVAEANETAAKFSSLVDARKRADDAIDLRVEEMQQVE